MKRVKVNKRRERLRANISDKIQMYMRSLQFFDDDIDDYIYIFDLASDRIYFTDKIREKFPLPPSENRGITFSEWNDVIYPKDREFVRHYQELFVEKKIESFNITHRIVDKNGNKVWINVKGTTRENENEPYSRLLVGRVSEMVYGRTVDNLTGLRGMEKFMEDLEQYQEQDDGYLMVLGVDNFKNINITQGRSYGDDILKRVTEVLDQHSEYPMSLYRLDGDCFAVIFPEKKQADVVEFYHSVQEEVGGICSVSAGAVPYTRSNAPDGGAVYQYAESALDQAKKRGKDRMIFFSADRYQRDRKQVELLNEMRECVNEDFRGFYLCYQPQVASQNYSIHGVEALLRFRSPARGLISPAEFIPLLEESGLICHVGEWVLKTALHQCKEWRKQIPNLHISVNISYVQLQQSGMEDMVLNLLKDAGLPGDVLTLEVTESMQLQDYFYFNKIFYAWKQYGIGISIDDFGTGYSSLSYLKSIEIDEVKIDRCFVDHVQHNAYNYRLLSNMIELAHSAKIRVCCEGVETHEELMALQELHTDLQQGYLFAKPLTEKEFEQSYICTESKAYQDRKAREANFRQIDSSESKILLEELRKDEIVNIVESMEETVYVADTDTYELYYLNTSGRRVTGVYDYKGCKCYQVLQGKDRPCEFCTNQMLVADKFHVWEQDNTFLKRKYLLKDKLIPWQGKIARMEIAIDITEREVVSHAIQKKLDFEEVIVECCKLMVREGDTEKTLYGVMKILGEFSQSDRVYILKNRKDSGLWDILWEWCAEGADNAGDYEDTADLIKTMAYFLGYSMIGEEIQEG